MEEFNIDNYIKTQNELKNTSINYKEFSENDSYVIRDFKKAIQNRLLWKYLIQIGVPDTQNDKNRVFSYFSGRFKKITNRYVFLCREKVQPSKWYYKVGEELPPRINFTPKHSVEDLRHIPTAGIQKFLQLQKEYSLRYLCKIYNLNELQMKNIIYAKFNPETQNKFFRALPPYTVIIPLREVINPDLWFIFPDELTD